MKERYAMFGCYIPGMKIGTLQNDGNYKVAAVPSQQTAFMEIDEFDLHKINVPKNAISFAFFEFEDEKEPALISWGYIGQVYDIPHLEEIAKVDPNANNILNFIKQRGGDGAIKSVVNFEDGLNWWTVYKKGMTVVEI